MSDITMVISVSGDRYLERLRKSVKSLKMQEGDYNISIIISCLHRPNASTSALETYSKDHNIFLVKTIYENEAFSLSLARNAGARRATTKFVGFSDADVITNPRFVKVAMYFIQQKDRDGAFALCKRLGPNKGNELPARDYELYQKIQRGGKLGAYGFGGSVIIYRNIFEKIRGFDENFIGWGAEDTEFLERMQARKYKFLNLSRTGQKIFSVHIYHGNDFMDSGWKNDKRTWRNRGYLDNRRRMFNNGNFETNPGGWGGIEDSEC